MVVVLLVRRNSVILAPVVITIVVDFVNVFIAEVAERDCCCLLSPPTFFHAT